MQNVVFFLSKKERKPAETPFPKSQAARSPFFGISFPGVLRMRRQGRTPVCPGSLGKTKVRTRDGSAKSLLFRRGGVRAAFGTKGGGVADSAEDRAASSGQTVPQNSAYDGLFRLFRRLVGTISCRLRMSETGDRPRESSVFLPTDRAGRCSRSPRWGRVGFPGRKHSPPSDQVQAGGFRGGALFLPGAFCRQKSGRPCRRKADMMYLYTTLF